MKSKRFNLVTQRQSEGSPASTPLLPSSKRQRRNNEDFLICCISLSLPLDPVMADDGQLYERTAIENYFRSKRDDERIISPITRKIMSTKLLPSPQIKSTIETMIENGAITGLPAEDWKNRMKEMKEMEALIEKAQAGDAKSMETVAYRYKNGINGFQKDESRAFYWYEKAYNWYENTRVAGSVLGLATIGQFLVKGLGVAKDPMKGVMYLGMAVGQGSDFAAFVLGVCLADGQHGVPVDKVEARKLLEKSLSGNCTRKHLSPSGKLKAKIKLDELVKSMN